MTWFVLSLLAAFAESAKDVVMKKRLHGVPETLVAWAWMVFALPLLLPALLLGDIPPLGAGFWLALLASGTLNAAAISLYVRAIQGADLSTTVPMIAFSPLFLLISAPLIVGETPTPRGLVGVLLVVAGSYLLNIKERRRGYLAPYRALFTRRGPRLMLAVAVIWSISSTIDKIGVQHSSPIVWGTAVQIFIALLLTPAVVRSSAAAGALRSHIKPLLLVGLLSAGVVLCQMTAITLTLVAYVIAVKRISTLLSVVFGGLILQEQDLTARLIGAAIMLLGVLSISLTAT